MSWIEIELRTTTSQCNLLEELLFECGACSVTLQDAKNQPVYEPAPDSTPLWENIRIKGLFTTDVNINTVIDTLKNIAPDVWATHLVNVVEDKEWEKECMLDFRATQFGEKLWVCPGWCEPPDPDAVNVMLDPGCGFGSGSHPTTAMCLEWLGAHAISGELVVDYGCGSGILGIASALLGAKFTLGVDIDPQALEASTKNAKRNHIKPEKFAAVYPENIPPGIKAGILLANILSGPLTEMASKLANLVRPGGSIVLSGILSDQAEVVTHAYLPWFLMDPPVLKENWVRLTGKKRPGTA